MKGSTAFKKTSPEDLERVIEKSDTSSSINSDEIVKAPKGFREQVKHLIHTTKFQVVVIILVVIDCLLVIGELLIDLKVVGSSPNEHNNTELSENTEQEGQNHTKIAAEVLHYCSIAILSIFLVELGVKLFAMGKGFFYNKLEIVDGVIVTVSFALDVAFADEEGLNSAVGLLVVLRFWRIGRIVNGVVLSVKAQSEKRIDREKRMREAAEEELCKFREYCSAQEHEIEALQLLLTKHGIEFQKMDKPQLPVRTIDVVAEVNQYLEATKVATEQNSQNRL